MRKTDEGLEVDIPGGNVVVITSAMLAQAEQEMLAEAALKGEPVPEHSTMADYGQPCEYCSDVSVRAAKIFRDSRRPSN